MDFRPNRIWPIPHLANFFRWGPDQWGPEGVGARTQKKWGAKGWGPEGLGAQRLGGPKFRAFFSLSRRKFRSLCLSLGVFSLNFGCFFESLCPQMCTFGLSGCPVKARRLRGRRGFTGQPENSKGAHFRSPALQTPPKFNEQTPRERRKNEISGGREKKERSFGRSRGRAVPGRTVRRAVQTKP